MLRKFWRIMRLLALFSIIIAAIAVILVMRGEDEIQIHMMIATALGVALSVLLAGALMTLVFLSSRSGHDEQARRIDKEEDV
jgi:uncharacterized membrane protein